MSLYDTFVNWASTKFISQDEQQMHNDVAAAQQARLNDQLNEGKRDMFNYLGLSNQVQAAGNMEADYIAENGSFGNVITAALGKVPLWLWLVVGIVVFWWLGGFIWLRGILAKGKAAALVGALVLTATGCAIASPVTLGWDLPPETNGVAGYRLHNAQTGSVIAAVPGFTTTNTAVNVPYGTTLYVLAIADNGDTSEPSNVVTNRNLAGPKNLKSAK